MRVREGTAVAGLGFVLAVTAVWWALALWPLPAEAPAWLARTRLVCFGAAPHTLPTGAGWAVLIGEPVAMLGALLVVWGRDVTAGLVSLRRSAAGLVVLRAAALLVLVGLSAAGLRVARASAGMTPLDAANATRVDRPAPPLRLVDQHGDTVALADMRGRPTLVAFAFGHCETVCPLLVRDALAAAGAVTERPAVLIVTLDPWRDTPARLATIAAQWHLTGDARVLGGSVAEVEAVLDAWSVSRVRDPGTGDVPHAGLVYVVDRSGRIAWSLPGGADAIASLVGGL